MTPLVGAAAEEREAWHERASGRVRDGRRERDA